MGIKFVDVVLPTLAKSVVNLPLSDNDDKSVLAPKFDRAAYQKRYMRDYMRTYRLRRKAQKDSLK